jgi:hypothetical protein
MSWEERRLRPLPWARHGAEHSLRDCPCGALRVCYGAKDALSEGASQISGWRTERMLIQHELTKRGSASRQIELRLRTNMRVMYCGL